MTVAQPVLHPSCAVRPVAADGGSSAADRRGAQLSLTLRERTRDLHDAAEAAFDLDRRLADRDTYAALLLDLRSFYAPAEDALATVTGWDRLDPAIDLGARRRATLLDDDLAHLGVEAPAPGWARPTPPRLDDLADGLGCLYVLEGSALGGRVIARRAQDVLGADLPVSFFAGAGRSDPGRSWRHLKAALDAFPGDATVGGDGANRSDRVVAAARRTFVAFTASIVGTAAAR